MLVPVTPVNPSGTTIANRTCVGSSSMAAAAVTITGLRRGAIVSTAATLPLIPKVQTTHAHIALTLL